MNIEELIKNLDPVFIIEFKNYIFENLCDLCSTKNSNSKMKNYFLGSVGAKYTKMEKQEMAFKNIFVADAKQLYKKRQIQ